VILAAVVTTVPLMIIIHTVVQVAMLVLRMASDAVTALGGRGIGERK
jgi:hypothetical protein